MELVNNTDASILDKKVTLELSLKELITIFCSVGASSLSGIKEIREKYYPQFTDEDIDNTVVEDLLSQLYNALGNTILPLCNLPPKEFY